MSEQIAYLNGDFLPLEEAKISTQDRGFLFGDGVYEVIPVFQKKLFQLDAHLDRLRKSLTAISIQDPYSDEQWKTLLHDLMSKHPWNDQFIYLQITRGIQLVRDHTPDKNLTPTVYAYSNPLKPVSESILQNGIKVVTLEDIRWLRCDIKATTLLPNVMMKIAAKEQGADDAILIGRDGLISEGTASNVFIVKDDTLLTPPLSDRILPGITRMVIEKIANDHSIKLIEQTLTLADLEAADEIWLTSSTKDALPVCLLNNAPVGSGKPGPIWLKMQSYFAQAKLSLMQAEH